MYFQWTLCFDTSVWVVCCAMIQYVWNPASHSLFHLSVRRSVQTSGGSDLPARRGKVDYLSGVQRHWWARPSDGWHQTWRKDSWGPSGSHSSDRALHGDLPVQHQLWVTHHDFMCMHKTIMSIHNNTIMYATIKHKWVCISVHSKICMSMHVKTFLSMYEYAW